MLVDLVIKRNDKLSSALTDNCNQRQHAEKHVVAQNRYLAFFVA